MATMYVIKTTYLEGKHKGKTHILLKGGYVGEETDSQYAGDCYSTLAAVKAACTRYTNSNKLNNKIEKQNNERRAAQGRPQLPLIYVLESYEPLAVETWG